MGNRMPSQGGYFPSMVDMQFLQDVVHVVLNSADFNIESVGNFFVWQTFFNHLQDA